MPLRRFGRVAATAVMITSLFLSGARGKDVADEGSIIAAKIDEFVAKHWSSRGVTPAAASSDAEFLRRLTLDLAGRVPTVHEAKSFVADNAPDKRAAIIRQRIASPEFALHFGRVLDGLIQQERAGKGEFLEFLRTAVREDHGWDRIYRSVLVGPWDDPKQRPASKFLADRAQSVDEMTADAGRVFFGVDISCAKCHDHPHVDDWKQTSYYGMVSFFKPTQLGRGDHRQQVPKETGDRVVKFRDTEGKEHVAQPTFLSGKVLVAKESPREALVREGLENPVFFRRAIVNQIWAQLIGRGLVSPIDQMHSANQPVVPGLLEWLADDFAAHGYDLKRLVAGIVSSRTYQLTSAWAVDRPRPDAADFAVAQVRPLSPEQVAMSLLIVTGSQLADNDSPVDRERKYQELERRAAGLLDKRYFDGGGDTYQASVAEALFMSNHADVQKLFEPAKGNTTERLSGVGQSGDHHAVIDAALWTVLSRPAEADERELLGNWLGGRSGERQRAVSQLLWSLTTSSEFRFNH